MTKYDICSVSSKIRTRNFENRIRIPCKIVWIRNTAFKNFHFQEKKERKKGKQVDMGEGFFVTAINNSS